MPNPVTIPLLNPNEPESMIASLQVQEGQYVSKGDVLCTLETTKSAADLYAEADGYVAGLRFSSGQSAHAGDLLCYLAENPGWKPEEDPKPSSDRPVAAESTGEDLPAGLRITKPALALARRHQIDLSVLPIGPLVTEDMLKKKISPAATPAFSVPTAAFDPTAVLIYGGGGHGKMVIDLLHALGTYRVAGILDDGMEPGAHVMGVKILGNRDLLPALYQDGLRLAVNAVGGIGNIAVRIKIFHKLAEQGFAFPALAHPTAYIDPTAQLFPGSQVFVNAYLGSDVRLGFGCIVNTGAIISHDCRLGDYVNISPGAILAGEVVVEEGALIGMGVTVNLGVRVGRGARLGNSAVIKSDVPAGSVVRAGAVWPAD
jgi:acetyltransferase EpsM